MGRTGVQVSALGFGMLRLPMLANGNVDFDRSVAMVHRAIDGGVNYIDTGRVYLNGQSEQVPSGKFLRGMARQGLCNIQVSVVGDGTAGGFR